MKYKKKIFTIFLQLALFFILLLTFSLIWAVANYGSVGMEEIVFQMNVPLKGVGNDIISDFIKKVIMPALIIWCIELLWMYFPSGRRFCLVFTTPNKAVKTLSLFPLKIANPLFGLLLIVWSAILIIRAEQSFSIMNYIKAQLQQSSLIEDEYVSPRDVNIAFPEEKRNLICIYMESGESSVQDKGNGGLFSTNYIPELTQLAKDNISFSQSDLIEGAAAAPGCTWTIAGLVAQTTGLPSKFKYDGGEIAIENYEYFMPGVTSLGEILEDAGYCNYFMAGSDFDFGGRRTYFQQHGNYVIWDYYSAIDDGFIPSDYCVWWGMEDAKLFEYAKMKLLDIAQEDEPFNFSLLTADTHQPYGYLCEQCPSAYSEQYANVYACASSQINMFVNWIQQQDFYENTAIYICGDHCSMNSSFFGADAKDDYVGEVKRKVYNAFIHSAVEPVHEKNRLFTTMDMFPSILASLGAAIEGDRLGLGTNLFSSEETLSEKYGYETFFTELSKKSSFYNTEFLYPDNQK